MARSLPLIPLLSVAFLALWPATARGDDALPRAYAAVTLGTAPEAGLDRSLALRGFGPAARTWGGEAGALVGVDRFLLVGARVGLRARDWIPNEGPSAALIGTTALLAFEARFPIGSLDVGAEVGVGLGWAALQALEETDHALGPMVSVGFLAGYDIATPLRLVFALRGEWCRPEDLGPDDADLELGGMTAALRLEVLLG